MNFKITFSTWLTISRILLAPCVVVAIYCDAWIMSCLFFMIATATDFFDGYYARLYHQETEFGRLLDPVADKILIFSTLCALYAVSEQSFLPAWFVLLIASKEVVILLVSLYVLVGKKSIVIAPSYFAKCVTALFMLFIIYVMLVYHGIAQAWCIDQMIQFFAVSSILILLDYSSKFGIKL